MSKWRDRMQGSGQVEVRQPRRGFRHRDMRGVYMDEETDGRPQLPGMAGLGLDPKRLSDLQIQTLEMEYGRPQPHIAYAPGKEPRSSIPPDGRVKLPDGRIWLAGVGAVDADSPYVKRYRGPGEGLAPVDGGEPRRETIADDHDDPAAKPADKPSIGGAIGGAIGSIIEPIKDAIYQRWKSPAAKPSASPLQVPPTTSVPASQPASQPMSPPVSGGTPALDRPEAPPPPNALGGGLSRWYALNPNPKPKGFYAEEGMPKPRVKPGQTGKAATPQVRPQPGKITGLRIGLDPSDFDHSPK